MKIRTQITIIFSLIIILCIGILSFVLYKRINSIQFEQLRNTLISYAQFAAFSIDGDKHYKLSKYGNENSPEFFELRTKMRKLMKIDPRIAEMYTLVKTDKKNIWKFVIDADPATDDDGDGVISDFEEPADFGEEYNVSDYPEMQKAFDGSAVDKEINKDKWGWWLSGYAPIYDSKKNAVAVLGIDFSVDTIREEQRKLRNIIFFIAVVFLGSGLIVANFFSYKLTQPISKLITAAEKIGAGNYDYRVKIETKNELGFLAETMNSMAENIKRSFNKLSILNRTANILSSTLDLYQALKLSLNLVIEVTRATKGVVFLLNRQGDFIDIVIGDGVEIKQDDFYYFVDEMKIAKNFAHNWEEQIWMPMKKIGCNQVFVLGVKKTVRGFLALDAEIRDLDFLNTLMKQVSFAVENAGLFHEAITDSLTGLYLRRYFQIQLETEIKKAKRYKKPLSVVMIDIDYFKKINDKYGHLAGDFVLKTISRLIKQSVREVDIVSRYGGEEISILLPETSVEQALYIAERLREVVEKHSFVYKGEKIKVTISAGIFSVRDEDIEELNMERVIKKADIALYEAKNSGRNRVCVYNRGS